MSVGQFHLEPLRALPVHTIATWKTTGILFAGYLYPRSLHEFRGVLRRYNLSLNLMHSFSTGVLGKSRFEKA